ncbi:hypothetical protein D3C86_1477810 [compost metagenome]
MRLLDRDVAAFLADDAGDLELVVELLGVRGPLDVHVGAHQRAIVALVVDGQLVPELGHLLAAPLVAALGVGLEGQEVAQHVRPGQGAQEPHLVHRVEQGACVRARRESARHEAREQGPGGLHPEGAALEEGNHVGREVDVGKAAGGLARELGQGGDVGGVEIEDAIADHRSEPIDQAEGGGDLKGDELQTGPPVGGNAPDTEAWRPFPCYHALLPLRQSTSPVNIKCARNTETPTHGLLGWPQDCHER